MFIKCKQNMCMRYFLLYLLNLIKIFKNKIKINSLNVVDNKDCDNIRNIVSLLNSGCFIVYVLRLFYKSFCNYHYFIGL